MSELDNLFDNKNTQTGNEFSKEEWIKQKIESCEEAYVMLEIATEELDNPDSVMAYLDIQSRFDRYSVSNSLLIAYQNPDATRICDSKTWQKNNVRINKGEKEIVILEPGKPYTRDDGRTITPYNAKKMFDISQTSAAQRTPRTKMPDARVVIKALIRTSPVPVEISSQLPEDVKASYQPGAKKIFIKQGLNSDEIFRSLSKEIAFARLDKGGFDRENLEFTAQAISYVTTQRVGYTPEPITAVSDKFLSLSLKEKRSELMQIRDQANAISDAINKSLKPKNKEHGDR